MDELAGEHSALLADLAGDPGRPDLARRVQALTVAYREARAALAGHVFADAFAAEQAPAEAPADRREQTAPMARVYQMHGRRPRPAHAAAPAVFLGFLGRHGAPHALHVKLGVTAAAVAGLTATAVTYTIATTPDRTPAVLAPAGIEPAAATPAAVPRPATTRPVTPVRHRRHARAAAAPVLAAPPPPAPSPPQSPSLSSPAPPPPAAPGVLNVQQPAVTLQQGMDGDYSGTLTLYATGGPARWAVNWLGTSSVLRFDQTGGVLQDGQPVTVTVTVDAAQVTPGGSWTITLDPDGQPVTVTAAG